MQQCTIFGEIWFTSHQGQNKFCTPLCTILGILGHPELASMSSLNDFTTSLLLATYLLPTPNAGPIWELHDSSDILLAIHVVLCYCSYLNKTAKMTSTTTKITTTQTGEKQRKSDAINTCVALGPKVHVHLK